MHRSSSANRVSDESAAAAVATTTTDLLPKYNPLSHAANKERNRHKSAETAVHLIPLLLLLCVFILWFFSTPVDLVHKDDDPFIARIESLTVDGDIDENATSSWLPDLELRDSKSAKHLANPDPLER
ncbi:hypothetical protein Vadar_022188 [Vaccinium darrowii]|uniref:Uncharacterized protein n=1 Tax=Vaccinium darrowii TaxID=229202 RepID=A0ACB7X2X1_9ERIC|nr:hypothetical protein Vadar_022188 [Vaccinium darrowii]